MTHNRADTLFQIAQQLILEEQSWDKLKDLNDDDRAKVKAIVSRGVGALSESQKKYYYQKRKVKRQKKHLKDPLYSTHYVDRVSSRVDESQFINSNILEKFFPIERLLQEKEVFITKLMEELMRKFTKQELALLLSSFSSQEMTYLLDRTSTVFKEEIAYFIQSLSSEYPVTLELLSVRFSILTLHIIEQEEAIVSTDLKAYYYHYINEFQGNFMKYNQELIHKLKIDGQLQEFNNKELIKLLGLFPRPILGVLIFLLPLELTEKILNLMPTRQQSELVEEKEQVAIRVTGGIKNLLSIMDAITQAASIIEKYIRNQNKTI